MITDWLDKPLKPLAVLQKRDPAEYAASIGSEGIANVLQFVADQFAKPLLSVLLQFATAVLAGCYATWAPNVSPRTRRELATISAHEGFQVIRLFHYPFNLEIQQNALAVASAAQRGDVTGAMAALLRSPSEFQGMFAAYAQRPASATMERSQPYTPAPTPEIRASNHVVGPAFGGTPTMTTARQQAPYGVTGASIGPSRAQVNSGGLSSAQLYGSQPNGRAVPYGAIVSQMPYGSQSGGTAGRFNITEPQQPYGQESQGLGRYT